MRILKTFLFLLCATISAWGCAYWDILTPILPPLLFGLAIILSNDRYFKYELSGLVIMLAFTIIFLWGTLPFYGIGQLISDKKFVIIYVGALGCFLLTTLTIRLTLKQVHFGFIQFIGIIILSFFAVYSHSILTGQSINYEKGLMHRFDLTVLLYQLFLTVNILAMMVKKGDRKKLPFQVG